MKYKINLNKEIGLKKIRFPDSQTHIILDENILNRYSIVDVDCSLNSYNDLIDLLLLSNSLSLNNISKDVLRINYLISARYDRVMIKGDSFDLSVVSDLINSCSFNSVEFIDVHSKVSTELIKNSISNYVEELYFEFKNTNDNTYLVCPDKGAYDRVVFASNIIKNNGILYCDKKRDDNGNISLKVSDFPIEKHYEIVIVDDLCDGGGTFLAIASQFPKEIKKTLIITHGIFSKGFDELNKYFDKIICTNSYSDIPDYYTDGTKKFKTNVTQIKL